MSSYALSKRFGTEIDSETTCESDIVTAIEFDEQGDYIVTGDRGGRIVIFTCCDNDSQETENWEGSHYDNWKPYFQFKSHEAEFDYLKSLEIEEKINSIKLLPQIGNNKFVLSTNDKTIKLWKVCERQRKVSECTENLDVNSYTGLRLPRISKEKEIAAIPKRSYQNAHTYHINSISLNSDCETFLSADDLRINWWNFERTDTCFNAVDIKPPIIEELTEVITSACFHPSQCNILMHSSSRGILNVVDTRQAALCDKPTISLEDQSDGPKSFFSEIISSISDCSFSNDGRYIVSRDYMTVKVWDMHMDKCPMKTIQVSEHLRPMLGELYETDCIFDKFNVSFSPDGKRVVTGTYNNEFAIWDVNGDLVSSIDLVDADRSFDALRDIEMVVEAGVENRNVIQAGKKILRCIYHPIDDSLAVVGQTGLFLFQGSPAY